MESVGEIDGCPPAASANGTKSHSGKTMMSDGKSTNKTSRATAYQALGMAEDSIDIVLRERNTARKAFLAFRD